MLRIEREVGRSVRIARCCALPYGRATAPVAEHHRFTPLPNLPMSHLRFALLDLRCSGEHGYPKNYIDHLSLFRSPLVWLHRAVRITIPLSPLSSSGNFQRRNANDV